MDKASLRAQLKASRNRLTARQQSEASKSLLRQFIASQLQPQTHVALYIANDGEINPRVICEYLWSESKETYLPKLSGDSLSFVNFGADSHLAENKYGIPEPQEEPAIEIEALDLILVPLVGFDEAGNRIGMGAGYYDRALHRVTRPKLIGLAHEVQKLDSITSDNWDIPLDGVLTDKNYYSFN